ncbi:MAG: acyl-CoA desaturase [Phycisphaera sp.]|nr:MAG: acyl-CoA desaturase [Phycisphaera sp.]
MTQDSRDGSESQADHAHENEHIRVRLKVINLIGVLLPFAGLVVAISLLWNVAFNWVQLGILLVMYVVTALGITVGYHRLFTHRSFKTPRVVEAILSILGSMAAEGPVLQWVAQHRMHHQHSDAEHDPHSPHGHGTGVFDTLRGMWHAHMGWFIYKQPRNLDKYTKDLRKSMLIVWMSRLFPVWVLAGLVLPAIFGGLFTWSWGGVLWGFIWGGLVRVFLVHHVTWSINSVCHIWGTKPFKSNDESRNNAIFGVLALGEGWHNNHHAFPTSARHGLRWWQVDVSYFVIWCMSKIGLASEIRVPSRERIQEKAIA